MNFNELAPQISVYSYEQAFSYKPAVLSALKICLAKILLSLPCFRRETSLQLLRQRLPLRLMYDWRADWHES
jgi:hypothetical protein